MIVFLTLCYIAVLAALVKLGAIRLNTFWKLSPILWMLALLILLFIPMQWGAPSGTVLDYQTVVEIIPNVSGEVVEVPVKPREQLEKGDVLFRIDPQPFQYRIDELNASLKLASRNLKRALDLKRKDFAAQYDVDRYSAEVASLKAKLETASYDLEQTTVRAPSDGYVIGLTLRPGQRVSNMPLRSWLAFVKNDRMLVAGINQNMVRHVRVSQPAEITFKVLPGQVFAARVSGIADITSQGQLAPSGMLPQAPGPNLVPETRAVVLELVEADNDAEIERLIQGGTLGTATIYTESATVSHVIRKVMMRMEAWMNYINPY